MATFYADPNNNQKPWIEKNAIDGYGFRNWHLMFFAFVVLLSIFILICCCIKFRIPRTKQQIEGDYKRKKLADKFQERLRVIQNSTINIDSIDLHQALKLIQEDFENNEQFIGEKNASNYLLKQGIGSEFASNSISDENRN